jgi:hypothetical protein
MSDIKNAMAPHWFSDAIAEAVATRDPERIAMACGDVIAGSPNIIRAIDAVIKADDPMSTGRPGIAQNVRRTLVSLLGARYMSSGSRFTISAVLWREHGTFQLGTDFVKWVCVIAHHQVQKYRRDRPQTSLVSTSWTTLAQLKHRHFTVSDRGCRTGKI